MYQYSVKKSTDYKSIHYFDKKLIFIPIDENCITIDSSTSFKKIDTLVNSFLRDSIKTYLDEIFLRNIWKHYTNVNVYTERLDSVSDSKLRYWAKDSSNYNTLALESPNFKYQVPKDSFLKELVTGINYAILINSIHISIKYYSGTGLLTTYSKVKFAIYDYDEKKLISGGTLNYSKQLSSKKFNVSDLVNTISLIPEKVSMQSPFNTKHVYPIFLFCNYNIPKSKKKQIEIHKCEGDIYEENIFTNLKGKAKDDVEQGLEPVIETIAHSFNSKVSDHITSLQSRSDSIISEKCSNFDGLILLKGNCCKGKINSLSIHNSAMSDSSVLKIVKDAIALTINNQNKTKDEPGNDFYIPLRFGVGQFTQTHNNNFPANTFYNNFIYMPKPNIQFR